MRAYLPLRLWAADDGDLALLLRVRLQLLVLLQGRDLHRCAAVADYATDMRALGPDNGAHRRVWYV